MNALRKSLLPLLLMGAMFTQSCKEDSTGPDNGGGTVTNNKPTQGSTYTYYQKMTQNGSTTDEDTVVYTATISPVDVKGKSNVYVFTSSQTPDEDRTIAYEANGNISILVPLLTDATQDLQWMTIPLTGSGGTSGLVVSDFEIDLFGTPMRTKVVASTSLAGTENITVGSKSYSAKKIKVTNNTTITLAGVPSSSSDDDYFWWIPEIGYYGKSEEGGQVDPATQQADELKTETLVRFKAN